VGFGQWQLSGVKNVWGYHRTLSLDKY
jgi:hypothetical protein